MVETIVNYAVLIFASVGFLAAACYVGEALMTTGRRGASERMVTVVFVEEDSKCVEGALRAMMYDREKASPSFAKGRVVAVDMGIDPETAVILEKLTGEFDNLFYTTRENYLDVVKLLLEN